MAVRILESWSLLYNWFGAFVHRVISRDRVSACLWAARSWCIWKEKKEDERMREDRLKCIQWRSEISEQGASKFAAKLFSCCRILLVADDCMSMFRWSCIQRASALIVLCAYVATLIFPPSPGPARYFLTLNMTSYFRLLPIRFIYLFVSD